MHSFSEAYAAAKAAVNGGDFLGKSALYKLKFKRLLAGTDLDPAQAGELDKFRDMLRDEIKVRPAGKVLTAFSGDPRDLHARAATLKMMKHLYRAKNAGGQTIWCYSPPVDYTKWVFDEVNGANPLALEATLNKETEVYTATQREVMATAVQLARSISSDVQVKLAGKSAEIKTVVRRYFADAATTDGDLDAIMIQLAGGYKRINAACNTGNIVISDEPGDRNSGGWKDWAFIYQGEAMSVIYLQGAWLSKANEATPSNQSPLYRCARTILHELSHKQVGTEDVVYGPKGLMVAGSTALSAADALHNADSWAYFAVDAVGQLTGPDAANGTRPCKAVLKVPTRTLITA